jgi:hypothetical protein
LAEKKARGFWGKVDFSSMSQNKSDKTAALTPEQQVLRNQKLSRQLMKKLRSKL